MNQNCDAVCGFADQVSTGGLPTTTSSKTLHRIAEVRRREGTSIRSVARQLGVRVGEAQRQEDPASDLLLSQLLRWKSALDVPLTDLIADNGGPLSEPIRTRARLLRIMKTVRSIEELSSSLPVQKLAETLKGQLLQLMPELEKVTPWPLIGQRRAPNEIGQIAERVFPVSFARDSMQ